MSNSKNTLIIGGSSGLGLELALQLSSSHNVIATGRRNPKLKEFTFKKLDLSADEGFKKELDGFTETLPEVDLFIYAAGFFQDGDITEISEKDIEDMMSVGINAPVRLARGLLNKQKKLPGFIAITSTSQWTPRLYEPIYTVVKSGLGMLANSLSLDERIGKVLVAGPAGMKTRFWENAERDKSTMLEPSWVAEQIIKLFSEEYQYKFVKILREPARVETVETRLGE